MRNSESRNLKNVTFPIDIYKVKLPWLNEQKVESGKGLRRPLGLVRVDSARRNARSPQTLDKFISKLALNGRIIDFKIINDPSIPEALARFPEGMETTIEMWSSILFRQ